MTTSDIKTPFARIAQQHALPGHHLPWLKNMRVKALSQFNRQGLPTPKEEDWKYTSVWPLRQQSFTHTPRQCDISEKEVNTQALLSQEQAYRFVIVDGVFSPDYSNLDHLPEGVTLRPLSQALDHAQPHLGKQIDISMPGFHALNTMLMQEGMVICLEDHVKMDKPVELLMIQSGQSGNLACHLRHVIVLGAHSQLTLIEHYVGLRNMVSLTDTVSEVVLATGAQLAHYKVQRESTQAFHIGTLSASQGADSQWQTVSVSLGGSLTRHNIQTQLKGEQAYAEMNGVYLTDAAQHVDHHLSIDHAVAHTRSQALYKGVLRGESHAVFNGKVKVHQHAQKTDANQQNHNLLLSRDCEIDSKPEMEIYADDVKCGHGSTVGQLDEEALFFLRARGIDEATAKNILTCAFAADVLETISNPVIRQALTGIVTRHLPGGRPS